MPLEHDEVRRGSFSNYFEVGCNEEEIIVRFGLKYEDQAKATVHYTVITTPGYARKLSALLAQTLREHELLLRSKREDPDPDLPPN